MKKIKKKAEKADPNKEPVFVKPMMVDGKVQPGPGFGWCHASCCSGETPIFTISEFYDSKAQTLLDALGYPYGSFGSAHEGIRREIVKELQEGKYTGNSESTSELESLRSRLEHWNRFMLRRGGSMVRLHKSGDAMSVVTDCPDEDSFVEDFCIALSEIIDNRCYDNDWEFQLRRWLPAFVDLCCKYRGYKNTVLTKNLYCAGNGTFPASDLIVSVEGGKVTFTKFSPFPSSIEDESQVSV